jgi:putative oxidoreductase
MHTTNERQLNVGLLLMRLGIAATTLVNAIPKLTGGPRSWVQVGKDLQFLPSDVPMQAVGIVLLLFQVLGSLGMITGGFFRLSAVLLTTVYLLYFIDFFSVGYKTLPLYAAALACICIGLMVTGPGRFAVALKIEKK